MKGEYLFAHKVNYKNTNSYTQVEEFQSHSRPWEN